MDRDLTGRTLGEFVVGELIAEGGSGTVYRAFQASLQRDVVIKVIGDPGLRSNAARERFEREARLASRLDHPYAAHVYAFGDEPDGLRWIAMELVSGVSLEAWLRSRGPVPLEQFVPLFERVAEVVDAVHKHGIVHRDIKTSNVMVIEHGGGAIPKLIDFGIAKIDCDTAPAPETPPGSFIYANGTADSPPGRRDIVTETGAPARRVSITPAGAIGSWPYMSPEQCENASAVGQASDIYALGILAYRVLTGRFPFVGDSAKDYFYLHREAKVPPLGADLPPSLDRVIGRALAKKPEARQNSATELAAELRAVLRTEVREHLRSVALQWDDRARPPDLLLRGKVLANVQRSVPRGTMSTLECSFVAASQRRARRTRWAMHSLAGVAAFAAVAVFMGHSAMQTRLAEQQARLAEQQARLTETELRAARELTEAKIAESKLEQGRAALLHGEPEALPHLAEAYKRAPAPATAFMLARAMQSRLAEKARFTSTHGRMWWATFSPDGSQIATADDRAAQIWDAKTYRLLFTLPHGCEVYQAIYSADGARLVTIARTMVRIWDARSGALLHDLKAGRRQTPSDFYRGAVSSDGRFVGAMDAGGFLARIWDMATGARVAELRNQGGSFPELAFSADGRLATTGGEEARVFDPHGWKQILSIPGSIRSLAFNARGTLVTGSSTGEVVLWSIQGNARHRQLRPSGAPVDAVAFSPDGNLVAAGSSDGTLQAWRTDSGSPWSQINPHRGKIVAIEFAPDAARLLAGTSDGTVVVADVPQALALAVLDGPSNALRVARFAPDGRHVVGASWDGTARVWDAASPYRRWTTAPTGDACNIGMGSRPDGRFIAVGCRTLPTRVWDTARDLLLAELPGTTPLAANDFIDAAPAVSARGDLAAVARGQAVEVYELPGGRLVRTVEHDAPISAIAFTDADSSRAMVSGALDGSVRVVREDGSEFALQASGGVEAATVLPDGRVLVADAERHLRVYAADGTVLTVIELPVRIMSLRREGARLVALANCLANVAPPLVIDLEHHRIDARLEGHIGWVLSAHWVSGGRIVTAGADGTARLWDGTTGRLLQTFRGSSRFLGDAALVSGLLVGGDADGLLRFWDAASGAKLWTLPVHKSAVVGIHFDGADIVTRGSMGEISRWRLPQSAAVIDACAGSVPCAIVP